ncbi:MAG: Transcriptional activator protein NhaR [Deltaproteobacteria bacterium ADurb.Bin510]|nr:MAG: Transcriptional activator protein NhaR [Deltaproteobacteria bacterium ADurb.Bin510]
MDWLNYHHLFYFWQVAHSGSLAEASRVLGLSPSALSSQIRALETALGNKLFEKSGRGLRLTETGRLVYRYAGEIFSLGRELQDALADRPVGRGLRVTIGVADVVPKLVARELIGPALRQSGPVRLVCREDKPERLLAELATHEFDIILTDAPASPHVKVKAFNHRLGESEIVFMANPELAKGLSADFPAVLGRAPLLLPGENTALRRVLEQWFAENDVRPSVAGEFDDNALMNVFGEQGLGLFPAPALIAEELERQLGVRVLGRLPQVRQRYYAVTVDRRIHNPAAEAICHAARERLAAAD